MGNINNEKEILFVADIEHFTKATATALLQDIKRGGKKLVVFIGDILSFLEEGLAISLVYNNADLMFELFYDIPKSLKKANNIELTETARSNVGLAVSDYIQNHYTEEIGSFLAFAKSCEQLDISIIYYCGNHDSMISLLNYYARHIPLLRKIQELKNLHIPRDLEMIRLNDKLSLLGVHTRNTNNSKEYPQVRGFIERTQIIENPSEVIFVSHVPGIEKFTNLGSEDITNLKKKFKFKYHYHGHCNDYYGEYLEKGVPTRSVHFKGANGAEVSKIMRGLRSIVQKFKPSRDDC